MVLGDKCECGAGESPRVLANLERPDLNVDATQLTPFPRGVSEKEYDCLLRSEAGAITIVMDVTQPHNNC